MEKAKIVFAISLVALILCTSIAFALLQWSKTFVWQLKKEGFQVYHEDKTTVWQEGLEDLGVIEGTIRKNFWIKNIGNVPITVKVVVVEAVNCIYDWSNLEEDLEPNQGAWFNLTLTATGDGKFSFTFQKQ